MQRRIFHSTKPLTTLNKHHGANGVGKKCSKPPNSIVLTIHKIYIILHNPITPGYYIWSPSLGRESLNPDPWRSDHVFSARTFTDFPAKIAIDDSLCFGTCWLFHLIGSINKHPKLADSYICSEGYIVITSNISNVSQKHHSIHI